MKIKLRTLSTSFILLVLILTLAIFPIYMASPTVVAQKSRGMALESSETVKQLPANAKRFALIIGVDNYADTQISTLGGSVNDAKALADALVRYAGFPKGQVVLLATDQPAERQPTRGNILRRLSNLAAVVPKDALFLFAFAGHGADRSGQAFLLPSDAQVSDDVNLLEQTAINVVNIKDWIRRTGVGQVLMILDACRNDPAGRANADNPLTKAYTRGFNFDVRNREVTAFATLYATQLGHRAYEYKEKRHGYFTWTLVEALKGGAANERGEVTLAGLVNYLQERVPKHVLMDLGPGKKQVPWAMVEGYKANELVIAVAKPTGTAQANATTIADSNTGSVTPNKSPNDAFSRNLEGTAWKGQGLGGEYQIVFLPNGVLRYKERDSNWTVGTWKQTENSLFFEVAEYSLWQGKFEGSLITGEASNKADRTWRWYMSNVGAAEPSDLSAESIAGTTWKGNASSENFTIKFLKDGQIQYQTEGGKDWTPGTWQQAGVTVRFVLNGASAWEGNIEGREMKGTFYILGRGGINRPWSITREGS